MDGHETVIMLRVHSDDLDQHILEFVGKCLDDGLYTDLVVRCADRKSIRAHKMVFSAVSPYIKSLLEWSDYQEEQIIELPDVDPDEMKLLVEVVYKGVVEATMSDLRKLILLARSLYISIPVSDELLSSLDIPPLEEDSSSFIETIYDDEVLKDSPLVTSTFSMANLPLLVPLSNSSALPQVPGKQSKISKTDKSNIPLPPPLKRFKGDDLTITTVSEPPKSEFVCPFCNAKYSTLGSFKQHMSNYHMNEAEREEKLAMITDLVKTSYYADTNMYNCPVCKSNYSHPGNFKQHLGKHERETGAITAMYRESGKHLQLSSSSHATKDKIEAAIMEATRMNQLRPPTKSSPDISLTNGNNNHLATALKSALWNPVEKQQQQFTSGSAGNVKLYTCNICERTFKHPGNYKQHMASHTRNTLVYGNSFYSNPSSVGGKVFKCDICDEILDSEVTLTLHKAATHNPDKKTSSTNQNVKLFKCQVSGCHHTFSRQDFLDRHAQIHHSGKLPAPGVVAQQGSSSSSSSPISSSTSSQFAPKPAYQCPTCGKAFFKSSKLSAHMKIHRPSEIHYRYPCDICGKKFTRPQHVNRHKRLHTGEKPFDCDKCGKRFNREDKLKNHLLKDCEMTPPDTGGWMAHPMEDNVEGEEEESEGVDPLEISENSEEALVLGN